MSFYSKIISYNKTKYIFDFLLNRTLSPDHNIIFLKKFLYHILPNVKVFSRHHNFSCIVDAWHDEIYNK